MALFATRRKRVGVVTGLVVTAVVVALVVVLWGNRAANKEEGRMRALIARLAHAESHAVTFVDLILWTTKEDETVRDEILVLGKKAVPYLIEGLCHRNEYVRIECADLLGSVPTKDGIAALIQCLETRWGRKPPLSHIQWNLHDLTGHSTYFPPKGGREAMRRIWGEWWEKNKERLVETEGGLGLREDDGTVTPLPLKKTTEDNKPEAAGPEAGQGS